MKPGRPFVIVLAVLATNLAALCLVAWWRLRPGEQPLAWPWPQPLGTAWPPALPAVLLLLALALALAAWRRLPHRAARRDLATVLLWPAVPLAVAWLVLPAVGPPTWPAVAVLAGLAALGIWLERHALWRPGPRWSWRRALLEDRLWCLCHGLLVVLVLVAGLQGGGFADGRALLLSLVLYPVYALVQLFLLLVVPWPHLRRLAPGGPGHAIVTVSLLFALIHWPNPVLMLLTGGGMAFWSREHDRGRPLLALALSMGLLATLAAQGLPDAWTDHMRAGPGCVRQRAITATATAADAASAHLPAGRPRTEAFVAALYPATAGRPASPEELARWWGTIASARRGVLAWRFYISREYRTKFGEPAGEAPLPGNDHWTDLPAPWPERIGAFTRSDPALPLDDWTGFLRRLYREILHREATASELAAWPRELSPRQRERIAGEMLARGRRLATTPFDTLTCAELRLHH